MKLEPAVEKERILIVVAIVALVGLAQVTPASGADGDAIRRTRTGKPDLTGVYDITSLTPFERPTKYGDRMSLTEEEAIAIEKAQSEAVAARARASDPEREPPAKGGNVGAYNDFWFDWGTRGFAIDGQYRTSVLIDPPNGRMPAMNAAAKERLAKGPRFDWGKNTGTAWWMETGEGPYDDQEYNVLGVRCIYQPTATIAMRSLPYNNLKTIVQTDDYVTIMVEWMHWARIIRLDSEHLPAEMRSLGGDSIGWWDGDTLVVETTNFLESPGVPKDGLRILEYFSPIDADTLRYKFTVNDPDYDAPYTGELVWPRSPQRSYEYACLEGYYAMGNTLRGARLLEQEWLKEKQAASSDP